MRQFQCARAMLFLTVVVTILLGGPGPFEPMAGQAASDPVLVKGKGFRITEKDLEAKVQNLPFSAQELFTTDEGKEYLLKELVRIEVFAREARSKGMEKDAAFQAKLAQVTNALLATEYTKRKILNQPIKEEDVQRYYTEHSSEFKVPERIKAPFIFIGVPKGASKETWKEKETKAKEIHARAKSGEDFAKLLEATSDAKEREWDYFPRGRLSPEVEEDVFHLKVGEISPVLRIDSGLLIFKLEGKTPETLPPYEEVKSQVKEAAQGEKRQKAFEEMEKKLFDKYGVVFTKAAPPESSQNPGPGNNPEAATVSGKITHITLTGSADQSRLLGTIIMEGKPGEKYSVDISPQTALFKKTAQGKEPANLSDLKKGQWLEVTPSGPALQSYPVQLQGGTIVILPSSP